ncbi:MAG: hypothetical protein A2750_01885 [Candidatus Yanofskybacteria bacterium RIFCSPHIGHO2_01_FULL_45_42]|uniref:DUF218 domain-containing protein n=3 Tax=Candidatus Yanofskyibacteriota TaxID=1752733 RepID=A0A1F8F5P2_9BACT|nr:MAG: hypothetical protein A2750_01885 [Candidatus Yanofskybacteria bacterium RIFCSPHIGHO2_01_FULL_45_42]OGN15565.1 MAG: hypothetical protein A3C81_00270 [Candidatus Yanofskybacteria bacterium RIFCSPHIGHO2_02_FULL_46_19]OGN27263.1 MAG: hypothetical protein A3B17_00680 [Candidatus Yanofskybacteria bacterium RIFCSPLOWO2_01_FULL_45_72]OGN32201.1 MAG: hypothetical protein A3J01_01260 [Candidatus Yanofskybacteria bacterium RIFCSPLOWO2_02_FULL_45_18]
MIKTDRDSQAIAVVVCGYGLHLTPRYREYLNRVAELVKSWQTVGWQVAVIATGGYTCAKTAPGVSEAEVMIDYLSNHGVNGWIYLEDSSVTTNENIKFAGRIILRLPHSISQIVVFCDDCRRFKVGFAARYYFGAAELHILTYDITQNKIQKLKQYLVATPLDIMSCFLPFLERLQLKRKEKLIAIN